MSEEDHSSLGPERGPSRSSPAAREPSTSMVERVALAIFKSSFHPDDAANEALVAEKREQWAPDWRRAERAAVAAIEAMLKPAPWMIDEGCGAWVRVPIDIDRRKFGVKMLHVYQAIVSAAFSDEPGNPETIAMINAALEGQ